LINQLRSGKNYKWIAIAVIAIGLFASVADNQGMVVSLPTIAIEFDTDLPVVQWVVVGYSLTITVLLLPMGRLGDIIGRKKVYIWGFLIFVLAGFAAGRASSVEFLVIAKVLQGVGSAMTQGTAMAMVIAAFPQEERGKALGVQMSVVGVGGILGPTIAGFLIASFGWPWVFYGTAGVGLVATIGGFVVLKSVDESESLGVDEGFDWGGAVLSAATLIAFHAILLMGPLFGWISFVSAANVGIFLTCIGLFVYWELRVDSPMLTLSLFRDSVFVVASLARYTAFLAMSSVRFLMPFYLEWVLGFGTGTVGLILVPAAICMILTGPISGPLADRYGWRRFSVSGLLIICSGLGVSALLGMHSHVSMPILIMVLVGLGTGIFNPANGAAILNRADRAHYGVVAGFTNLLRNSGNVSGISLATAIVSARLVHLGYDAGMTGVSSTISGGPLGIAFLSGMQLACLAVAGALLVAVLLIVVFRSARANMEQPVLS